jgi:hypothetical protein
MNQKSYLELRHSIRSNGMLYTKYKASQTDMRVWSVCCAIESIAAQTDWLNMRQLFASCEKPARAFKLTHTHNQDLI